MRWPRNHRPNCHSFVSATKDGCCTVASVAVLDCVGRSWAGYDVCVIWRPTSAASTVYMLTLLEPRRTTSARPGPAAMRCFIQPLHRSTDCSHRATSGGSGICSFGGSGVAIFLAEGHRTILSRFPIPIRQVQFICIIVNFIGATGGQNSHWGPPLLAPPLETPLLFTAHRYCL